MKSAEALRQPEAPRFQIEKFDTTNFSELIPLFQACFGRQTPTSYFEWKYLRNPEGPVFASVARAEDGRIAAFYGVIPERYWCSGIQRVIFQSCDTMTHPDFQRMGLFRTLANSVYNELRKESRLFVLGFGGPTSTPGFLKFGWQKISDCQPHVRLPFQAKFTPRRLISSPRVKTILIRDFREIVKLERARSQRVAVEKTLDEKFLEWRLSDPTRTYSVFGTYDSQKLLQGYFILSTNEQPHLRLLHLRFRESASLSARLSLMNALDEQLIESRKSALVTYCQPGSSFYRDVHRCGFFRNPFSVGPLQVRTHLIFLATQEEMNQFGGSTEWSISPIDNDSY